MWVRTTITIKRWTEEKTGHTTDLWDESQSTDISRLPSWEREHPAGMESNTDVSSLSSKGECKETARCCWKHRQCPGHIIHPFSDCCHHNLHLHAVHCNCESRCKGYRPVSVAVIHYPVHHECGVDALNDEEEEENQSPISIQACPTSSPANPDTTGSISGFPDSATPITIWRSESPTDKRQVSKVIKKTKKKEKEKEKEMTDEKAKVKKPPPKSKLTKKSPVKSESSPPDLSGSVSPRVRTSESSPESREELESEDSYERGRERPCSDGAGESSSWPRKRKKTTAQARKNGTKSVQAKKVAKRKSPCFQPKSQ